jgi:metallo-beta-lactamase family protein
MNESIAELANAVRETFRRGGNIIIPSFAVGRTQDILYILHMLVKKGQLDPLDVYVDSPLAEEATDVYLKHPEVFDEEALRLLRTRGGNGITVRFTKTVEESRKLNSIRSGIVIIAGSGMCEGGRVSHHLKHNLWRRECSIVFVGFQAEGTLGREIVDRARKVEILGEPIAVRAAIHTIGGFSAHADRDELLDWLRALTTKPQVFVVHGEEQTALDFAETVGAVLGLGVTVPKPGEGFDI